MKKQNKVFKLFSVLVATFLIFSSCQIGLGPAIDLEAPIVELTSHKDNDYVGQTFNLAGTVYDNEKVKSVTIDFDEADIHFKLENGVWKKKTSYVDWVVLSDEYSSYSLNDKTVYWSVWVSTSDSKVGMGSTYNFTIVAEDEIGNSGKTSKLEGSLVVDENIPEVSINSPELFATYAKLESDYAKLVLNDGNVISQLLNGTIVLDGRQDSAASFKEFRIEFDNGITDSKVVDSSNYDIPISTITTEEISNAYPFERSAVYYSKTLKTGQDNISDLRTWNIQIKPEDWISSQINPELAKGKHKIRVVATSISNSDTWQRKILGFFTWYPEADIPWITLYSGTESLEAVTTDQTYPSTKIFGLVQDDDGIKSLTYSLAKQNADKSFTNIKTNETLALAEENTKNSQWYIESPAESAVYKLSVTVTDMYDNTASLERYFNVLDVQPPKISLVTPAEGSNVFSYAGTSIPLSGTVSDDGKINKLKVAYLYPEKSLENKIKFINHAEPDWNKSSDSEGNLIFDISLPEPSFNNETKIFTYNFSKNLDLFDDLKISPEKPLKTQDFVILAVDDAGGATVYPFAISGDSESPTISFTKFERYNVNNELSSTYELPSGDLTLGVIKSGDYAKIYGKWNDNSTSHWNIFDKINDIFFAWGENSKFSDFTMNSNGTWSVKVQNMPSVSTTLVAKLKDYAGNETSTEQSIAVDKAEIGIERIGAETEDGSYKAGSIIKFTLEFTKAAIFEGIGKPYLTLKNGKSAECKDTFDTGADGKKVGKTKITFEYTINAKDQNDKMDKDFITGINSNGCVWKDANTDAEFLNGSEGSILTKLKEDGKVLANRNISIDTQSPKISDITCLSKDGSYNAGKELTFKIEFDEPVNITNENEIKLDITGLTHQSTSKVGSNILLSKYKVNSDANSNNISVSSVTATLLNIKDVAGNAGDSSINVYKNTFDNINLDTKAPSAPSILGITDGSVITEDNANVEFRLGNTETGATVKYSIDGGSQWSDYKDAITLTNNGTYYITAYQIDAAGNESEQSETYTVTIDRGALLKRISATTPNGTYKAGDTINGYLEFRKTVTLPADAKVILNVKSGNEVLITNPETEAQIFNFEYKVQEDDLVDDLDVTGLSFASVTLDGISVPVDLPESKLATNKDIKILTGNPKATKVTITGQDENAELTVTFDRDVSKGSGTITLTQDSTKFYVPTVLTVAEYNDLKATLGNAIDIYYKPGVNGATPNSDNTLTPDTSTKYILNFYINNDGSIDTVPDEDDLEEIKNLPNLKSLFVDAGVNTVTIPIYSSAVSVNGSTLTAKLTGEFKLPVKGAEYSVKISENAVQDSVSNKNAEYTIPNPITAPGVEKPEIRIEKKGYEIVKEIDKPVDLFSDVNMPETAQMKIACQTPGSSIKYGIKQSSSTHVVINDCSYHNTKTADVTIPEIDKDYPGTITLGNSGLTFDTAQGMKFAIAAQASKGNSKSDVAYEYAARTVLKFYIGNKYRNADDQNIDEIDDNGNFLTSIIHNGKPVHVEKLTIWIIGGDSESGGNTIDPFPLSWGDPSNFKMMKLDGSKDKTTVKGQWYWITWDISAPTYHGFVAGDLPSDAQQNGPSIWYAGECFYTPLKSYYILYPGETLYMTMHDEGGYYIKDQYNNDKWVDGVGAINPDTREAIKYDEAGKASYFFRWKNIGTR